MRNSTHSIETNPKPAFLKGFLWVKFAGTATICAVLLPIHIFAIEKGHAKLDNISFRLYVFVLISCALFHSIYRINTILIDLGLGKHKKTIGIALSLGFLVFEAIAVYVFFAA